MRHFSYLWWSNIIGSANYVGFVQILGTPTREEIKCMNPNYTEFRFPQIKAHPWHKVIDILSFMSFNFFEIGIM